MNALSVVWLCFFFFNDTATTEIYTLSLHDALPISPWRRRRLQRLQHVHPGGGPDQGDRKSTRLNSSHGSISYAVFCLKKTHTHSSQRHNTIHESALTPIRDVGNTS